MRGLQGVLGFRFQGLGVLGFEFSSLGFGGFRVFWASGFRALGL